MRKTISILALTMGAASITTTTAQADGHGGGDCGTVSITEMDWGSAIVVTRVAKFLMERGYGCTVETVPSSTVPAVASLTETGEPDIVTELWLNGAVGIENLIKEGKVEQSTFVLSDGGVEGWFIPNYIIEEHPELATIEGVLANPELVGGRFHSCPEGWGCQISNTSYAKAFELEANGIEVFQHGSGETLAASIASAYENKEPWFGYYWAPTSVLGKYPMTLVDVGPVDEAVHSCAADKDCTDIAISGWPASPVATVVTTELKESKPAIHALMQNLSFTNEQMNTTLAWKEDNNATGEEAAVYFIQNYSDVWSGWLSDDAREKLSALIK